jgi:hypothetical protein
MPAAAKVTVKRTKALEPDPSVLIEGYGSLKGKLPLPHDIDWTKPIYAQVLARDKRHSGRVSGKRRPGTKKARPATLPPLPQNARPRHLH